MKAISTHTFHIPVMGLAFTVDTPLKVARFGISSVVSIVEDNLLEAMRKFYALQENEPYIPIPTTDSDYRAARITAYLNLLDKLVKRQWQRLVAEEFVDGSDIVRYFELLPTNSPIRIQYVHMKGLKDGIAKKALQQFLRKQIVPGSIDVNIMTKCDKTNYDETDEPLPAEFADAMAALRGYANSELHSSIVFSAGMNPRLYSYCETFLDFFPDATGYLKKKIVLKVSDYRSAMIQGKFLAKKGLWVSEFRIESGLNCGGHAFATEGYLLAPILEEFKQQRQSFAVEMREICNVALQQKGVPTFAQQPALKVTVQGGIGTANEHNFLLEHYQVDCAGWGSPFLLVPEATTVDDETMQQLAAAQPQDYYLSNASPLGVPFYNFRKSSADAERKERIAKKRPGSPCYSKYLSFNTEFTKVPICLASREYQNLKIKQLEAQGLPPKVLQTEIDAVTEKECICIGLATSAYLNHGMKPPHKLKAVSICPGPNLAYFSDTFSLRQMIDHIYGRKSVLNTLNRPNMFINELALYVDYLKKEITKSLESCDVKQQRYLKRFKDNLLAGIDYCKGLQAYMTRETAQYQKSFVAALGKFEQDLMGMQLSEV